MQTPLAYCAVQHNPVRAEIGMHAEADTCSTSIEECCSQVMRAETLDLEPASRSNHC
jgi:hypothetical protein